MTKGTYHHGDLRRALLQAAADAIAEHGVAAISMRDLARRAGVSHAAPTHHFGDKAGLLTAFAAQGYDELAKALSTSRLASNSFLELGVTYVRFAMTRRAHFEVMFRPDLYHADDPELLRAKARSADALYAGVADLPDGLRHRGETAERARGGTPDSAPSDIRQAGQAAWSLAHGFATLWLSGAFPDRDRDPEALARMIFGQLKVIQ
ncbi:TetR family transcriptional regulator [Paractinoplanes deccanensis]|uniref:TetR family transcriptional regulator n=1 Tax=Paractinoplanes deccanensis TaxID=113561 RepID=A0ABQ3Y8K8_9ACTN|nr:TetR/AcrR family transcriptional regulator [Actinoplanes deccanensis]GID76312.1 TetR family transcriptional regulator [Actinoplanes deccanensis]